MTFLFFENLHQASDAPAAATATKPPALPAAATASATAAMDIEEEDDEDAAALKAALALSEGMDIETVSLLLQAIVCFVRRGCPCLCRVCVYQKQEETSTSEAPASAQLAGPGLPENFRGRYELFAVVTHEVRNVSD